MKISLNQLFILICLLIIAHSALAQRSPAKKVFTKTNNSVVTIYVHNRQCQSISQGSGVVIDKRGLIITNFHILNSGHHFVIKHTENGQEKELKDVQILAIDASKDMMLLKIPEKIFPAIKIHKKKLHIGEQVYAIGSPAGLTNTISEGIISGIRDGDNKQRLIQVSCPISPGSSGGAIVNSKGELIGISTLASFGKHQLLNFAIPVDEYAPLIKRKHGSAEAELELQIQLGNSEFNKNSYRNALSHYLKALSIQPDNTAALYNSALIYLKSGQEQKGIEFLNKYAESSEKLLVNSAILPEVHKYIGDYYYKKRDEKYFLYFQKYLEVQKAEDLNVLNIMMQGNWSRGKIAETATYAKRIIAANPGHLNANLHLAYIALDEITQIIKEIDEADTEYTKTHTAIAPDLNQSENKFAELKGYPLLDTAAFYAETGLRNSNRLLEDEFLRILGMINYLKTDYQKSIELLTAFLRKQPGHLAACQLLSQAYTLSSNANLQQNLPAPCLPKEQEDPGLHTVKFGGNTYTNTPNLLTFNNQSFLYFGGWQSNKPALGLIIYGPDGKKNGEYKNGELFSAPELELMLAQTPNELIIKEKQSGKEIFRLKREVEENHFSISGELFSPSGYLIKFSPESSNLLMLELIKGAAFYNSPRGISVN
jgi:tetratricopeptide (TPR) repeat protein